MPPCSEAHSKPSQTSKMGNLWEYLMTESKPLFQYNIFWLMMLQPLSDSMFFSIKKKNNKKKQWGNGDFIDVTSE